MPKDTRKYKGFSFVQEVGGIREFRLRANDMQVLVMDRGVVPVATLMVTYRVGSRNETVGLTGATHFLEHLMFKGTKRFNKRSGSSVFEVLQRVGAQVNATTWLDRTNYYEQLPSEHLELAATIEADRMRGALLRPADVEAERTVILNEFDRGENEPMRKLYHEVWSAAFAAHPYGNPTIGWRSDIEGVTASDLRGFYDTYYHPNNATVSVIGRVDERKALKIIRKSFGEIPVSKGGFPDCTTLEPAQKGPRSVEVHMPGQVGAVMVAFKSVKALDPDSTALEVLASILGSGKTSRLYRRLVEDGLASGVSAGSASMRDPGLFYVYANSLPGRDLRELEEAILAEVSSIAVTGPTHDEISSAQTRLRAQAAMARDGSFMIAAQLNEAIASGDWRLYPRFLEELDRVTAADVAAVAERTLVTSGRTTGFYVPAQAGGDNGV